MCEREIRDSSVGIGTVNRLNGRGLIPARDKIFLLSKASRPSLGPIQWARGVINHGLKRPAREAYHSPPYSAEIENGEAVPPLPHTSSWISA
jgi:hypothetical protein